VHEERDFRLLAQKGPFGRTTGKWEKGANMRRKLAVVLAAAALATVPLGASSAQAAETHVCNIWAPPYDETCRDVVILYCKLTPHSWICD
jgi:hypothetical protein